MTREQEIRNAIDTTFPISPFEKRRAYEQALMATGFEAGAQWADDNPKSPWISVKEKFPPEEKDGISIKVIVLSTMNNPHFSKYDYNMGGWISLYDIEFTHWMYLPELPKE